MNCKKIIYTLITICSLSSLKAMEMKKNEVKVLKKIRLIEKITIPKSHQLINYIKDIIKYSSEKENLETKLKEITSLIEKGNYTNKETKIAHKASLETDSSSIDSLSLKVQLLNQYYCEQNQYASRIKNMENLIETTKSLIYEHGKYSREDWNEVINEFNKETNFTLVVQWEQILENILNM